MLELILAQRARGFAVDLACPAPPPGETVNLWDRSVAAGVPPGCLLTRARGVSPWRDGPDTQALASFVARGDFDVVHAWHTRDHVLSLRAAARRRRAGRTRLVRSLPTAEPIARWPWNRWLFGRGTDALVCVSPTAAARNRRDRGGRPVPGIFGAVDLDRFAPASPSVRMRVDLGLDGGHRVVGVVARAQRHRRFDLLLEAAAQLAARRPSFRLLVVGRGTHQVEVVDRPARALGIRDRVILAGYRSADYADVLRTCDVLTYLVPGSDGGCRALLEAAACGIPAVATRRGTLPEIVIDGETGVLVDEDAASLAAAWETLLFDDATRRRLGDAARRRAVAVFNRERLAEEVEAVYAAAIPKSDRLPSSEPSQCT